MIYKRLFVALLLGVLLPQFFLVSPSVFAQSEIDKLRSEINDRSARLSEIEAEIATFEAELQVVGAEKKTLQSAINQLELERKKVNAEIQRTENLIASTDLEINKLVLEISKTQQDIDKTEDVVAAIIRAEYIAGDNTLIELLLRNSKLSEFWSEFEANESVRNTMTDKVGQLASFQAILKEKQSENEAKRSNLSELKNQYSNQNEVLVSNRKEQAELLEVTKNEEQNYQQLLATQVAAQEEILREMREFESKLQFFLDPNTVPTPGTAVFQWPLKSFVMTQQFGGTEFAKRNAAAYGGRPYHPGVDIAAPMGTPIYAPLTGTVRAVGNTDLVPGCSSWGKWTLIDHANGFSTLYAHQSAIGVTAGQKVQTNEIIGYVGSTGFSTGPHTHFTLYAKEGVTVRKFNEIKTVTSCGAATTPVAATEAYIDPTLYLPPY